MKLLWLTDPHLNFAGIARAQSLLSQACALKPDAFLISGDIGESHDLEGWLTLSAQSLDCPVYFVLGNHDYYGSSIAQVRADVSALCAQSAHLTWLSEQRAPISLSDSLALIGHDGWGDGRAGDLARSRVRLNDFIQIQELRAISSPSALATTLAALGDEAAEHLAQQLSLALQTHDHILAVMHVPPFIESCWHEGMLSDEQWAPFFVCQAAGQRMLSIMREHPTKRLTVLCGHTHGAGEAWLLPNLHVRTGGAVYRHPELQPALWFS